MSLIYIMVADGDLIVVSRCKGDMIATLHEHEQCDVYEVDLDADFDAPAPDPIFGMEDGEVWGLS